jgi:hypothetical protein
LFEKSVKPGGISVTLTPNPDLNLTVANADPGLVESVAVNGSVVMIGRILLCVTGSKNEVSDLS